MISGFINQAIGEYYFAGDAVAVAVFAVAVAVLAGTEAVVVVVVVVVVSVLASSFLPQPTRLMTVTNAINNLFIVFSKNG